jgi:hypothetical protein
MCAQRMKWAAFYSLTLFLLHSPATLAAEIRVPADQPTIQAGIDASVNGTPCWWLTVYTKARATGTSISRAGRSRSVPGTARKPASSTATALFQISTGNFTSTTAKAGIRWLRDSP